MKPRLLSVAGAMPLEIILDDRGLTIGRDSANMLRLDDPAVSARHCRIDFEDGQYVLTDLESMNGTFVNRKAATRANLMHGDEIQIGHTRLQFLVGEDVALPTKIHIADRDDGALVSTATTQLNLTDSAYLRAQFGNEDTPSLHRRAKDLSVLVKLSIELHDICDADELQDVLLQRIFERIPAEDGMIALGSTIDELVPGAQRLKQAGQPIYMSRTIVQQALTSGHAVLRNDLLAAKDTSDTIRSSGIRSVLCVPLTVMNAKTGVLYLSTRNPATLFDEQHLQLVAAIAGIGAIALEHARYVDWLEVENRQLIDQVNLGHGMVGENDRMKKVYQDIGLIAPTNSPALILGESGTGKELAARAIHNNSDRRNGPFIAVNCGAVVETLFSSQLFGYVRGAFTGADRDHKGFIEEADGGTLFLDELGDMPLHCQAALLRVLEEGKVQRVGSPREIPVDIRLISATNRSLSEEIGKGNFRADLYYRMGLPVVLPPLRDRVDDIPLLVNFFLQKYKSQTQREIGATHPDTIRILQQYAWPGNVRELGRAIQWAVVFGKSDRIRPEDLPPGIVNTGSRAQPAVPKLEEALQSYERQLIIKALEETHGNVMEAARLLDRAPNYLQRRISQLKLRNDLDRIRR
jgi:transcriptional regulator with GAF, ATPase, and Fis domain